MATAPNVYSAEPAYPVLAHSLLTQPQSRTIETERRLQNTTNTNDWNLQEDWNAGIQSSQPGIFRCGNVIGFSRLRTRSKDNDEYIGQIPRHLLATHLLKTPPSSEPSAFIIHPSNFDAFAPRILLNALQSASSQPSISRDEAICRLDAVQLFPVHNLPNAAQAIGKVSDSLQEIQEKRQHSNNTHPIILIVVGLDTLAEGIIRASNPVKGTALLAATLRNLTRMSRAYASYLSVILVNTNGLGPPHFESHQQPEMKQPQVLPEEDTRPAREDGLHSIFQVAGPPLLFNLLMRTLDQGIDTHILLSDVKAATVAEVIKARVGSGLGKWGIWISKQ